MAFEKLTFKSITARPVLLKLRRPVVARIATITEWPLILIDLATEEGIVGRSYLEPYIPKSMRYSSRRCTISARCSKAGASRRSRSSRPPASHCTSSATKGCR